MPSEDIIRRDRIFVGLRGPDEQGAHTLTWRIGYVRENGVAPATYVDLSHREPDIFADFAEWTREDLERYSKILNEGNRALLDQLQDEFEEGGSTTFVQRYEHAWDPDVAHADGQCSCGMWHPPHFMDWSVGPCWCGKIGVHNIGMGRP